jgi:hypothetical protein
LQLCVCLCFPVILEFPINSSQKLLQICATEICTNSTPKSPYKQQQHGQSAQFRIGSDDYFWALKWCVTKRYYKTVNSVKLYCCTASEVENLWELVFRHIKLKLLTKSSISCLSHPSMSITTWVMSVFAIACLRKNYAISEKLQTYTIMQIYSLFIPPVVLQVYQVLIKSELGWFFSLVHLSQK